MSNKNDPALGHLVHCHLKELGIETPLADTVNDFAYSYKTDRIEKCFHNTMEWLGLDLKNDSLRETPKRIAKMYCQEIFTGLDYANFPKCSTFENQAYDEMVSCTASVTSLCEHHFVPFTGVCHCAYIPNGKVVGLSKINRVVDFFARRPQVQERLTVQICETLKLILDTPSVAVVIQAEHMCVKLRGVQDQNSLTTTSKMSGKFMSVPSLRQEFLALTLRGK